jgi:aldehyde dehydrogenase
MTIADGKFVPPKAGNYFDNVSPIDGKVFTSAARSDSSDIECVITLWVLNYPH